MEQTPFHPLFVQRVIADPFLGQELLDSLNGLAPTSVRKNPFKNSNRFVTEKPVQWCENAFVLENRPSFTLDPIFHAGAYYPQEAGSMMLDSVLRKLPLPQEPTILDLCAAPGGKSTLIASFLNQNGLLVANEVIQARSRILAENLCKWGVSNAVVTNSDPSDFGRLPHFFDCILIDAPCSGEGMFRRLPASRNEWSVDNVQLCSSRQKRIVHSVFEALKPGGFLIYSTCTFTVDENEENIKYLLNEFPLDLVECSGLSAKRDRENLGYYCLPSEIGTEGFYFAVLQKQEDHLHKEKIVPNKEMKPIAMEPQIMELLNAPDVLLYQWKDAVFYLPEESSQKMLLLQQKLRIVKMGTRLGESTRKGLKWSEELPLSLLLRKDLDTVEFDLEQALRFLKCETFSIPNGQGMKLVKYENFTLGALKQIGNRFNTLWPKEWRIRQELDHLADHL